jgi:hypothetical protein
MANDDILDEPFHGCALAAFLEQAQRQQGWPDREATRRLAYQFYEEALAEKNRRRTESSATVGKTLTMPTKRANVEA